MQTTASHLGLASDVSILRGEFNNAGYSSPDTEVHVLASKGQWFPTLGHGRLVRDFWAGNHPIRLPAL